MKRITIAPFNYEIRIYLKDEQERFERDYNQKVESHELACVSGNGVFFKKHDTGIIFHEASHLVDFLLQDRLAIPNLNLSDTTEIRAYLIEYVGKRILGKIGV